MTGLLPHLRHSLISRSCSNVIRLIPCCRRGLASSSNSTPERTEKSTKDSTTVQADQKKDDIPFLGQPLGVRDRPTGGQFSWRDTVFDKDVRMDQRQKLVGEAAKGYFHDLNATRHNGGKTWIAPPGLIREDKARYFPEILGTPLDGTAKVHTSDLCAGKVSIISILSSKISEIQTHMYAEPTHAQYGNHRHYQQIQINLQENLLKSMLVSLFAGSIRKTVPKDQWSRYLISSQNLDYVKTDIGLTNKYIGYIYLVDPECRIRWAACADPLPAEIQALRSCTGALLKRMGG